MTPQKKLQASTGTHDPLFDNNQTWPTLIFLKFVLFGKSPKLPVHALNHDPQKKKLQAPTRAHDLLFWPKKIWPILLFPRFTPPNTFPKLPVHVLINDPPQKVTGINWDPWSIFWQQQNLTYFNIFEVCAFWQIYKASCVYPKSWPTKKKLQAPTRAHDLLFWLRKIWPTLFPRFTPQTHFQSFLCMP